MQLRFVLVAIAAFSVTASAHATTVPINNFSFEYPLLSPTYVETQGTNNGWNSSLPASVIPGWSQYSNTSGVAGQYVSGANFSGIVNPAGAFPGQIAPTPDGAQAAYSRTYTGGANNFSSLTTGVGQFVTGDV